MKSSLNHHDYYAAITAQDIVEVARALPELQGRIREGSGHELLVDCPQHASKSGTSLNITPHLGAWYCFGCGVGGGVIQLVEFARSGTVTKGARGSMPASHTEARDWLAERVGLPPLAGDGRPGSQEEDHATHEERETVFAALTDAATLFHEKLLERPKMIDGMREYWGIERDQIDEYRIGFATGEHSELNRLTASHSEDTLFSTGLWRPGQGSRPLPFFVGRLVIPYWSRGRVVYMIARQTKETPNKRWEQGKYKKLPVHDAEKHPHVSRHLRNDVLFGEDVLLGNPKRIVVAEGVTDAIASQALGIPTISPVTTRFRKGDLERVVDRLKRAEEVILVLDNELSGVGEEAALDTGLALEDDEVACRIATLPPGPSQLEAREAFAELLGDELHAEFLRTRAAGRRKLLESKLGEEPERLRLALELEANSKIDLCLWRKQGGDPAAFEEVLRTASSPIEVLIERAPSSGTLVEIVKSVEPLLARINRARPAARDEHLHRLKERTGVAIGTLRKEMTNAAKEADRLARREAAASRPASAKPQIIVAGGDLLRVVDESETALLKAHPHAIFQHGTNLVRCARSAMKPRPNDPNEMQEALRVLPVTSSHLTDLFMQSANYVRYEDGDLVPIDCPPRVCKTYLSRAHCWRISPLKRIIVAPTLRADGSILQEPGYDAASGLYFDAAGIEFPAIQDAPTREDAKLALDIILEPLKDFPFVAECDRSAMVAGIVTPLVRHRVRSAPLTGVSAPKMGSGKSLLGDITSIVATGHTAAVMTQGKDENEDRKRMLALLMDSDSGVLVIDNVERPLSSAALCSVLTQETFKDRELGFSRMATVSTAVTWIANGNNLRYEGDITTRVIPCELDARCERPEEREFKGDLRKLVLEQRPQLVVAALTILRAYIVAGSPDQRLTPFGRFEEWSDLIRSALVWVGMADPCEGRLRLERTDAERQRLRALLLNWHGLFGEDGRRVADAIEESERTPLHDVLLEIAGAKGEINSRRLGTFLSRFENRIEDGYFIERAGERGGSVVWRVRQSSSETPAGSEGGLGGLGGPLQPAPASPRKKNGGSSEGSAFSSGTHELEGTNPPNPLNPLDGDPDAGQDWGEL